MMKPSGNALSNMFKSSYEPRLLSLFSDGIVRINEKDKMVKEFNIFEMGTLLHGLIPKYRCVSFIYGNKTIEVFFPEKKKVQSKYIDPFGQEIEAIEATKLLE